MLERLAITVVCLVQWTTACWNGSDIPLRFSDLSLYNVSVDAKDILQGPLYQLADYDVCVYGRNLKYCLLNVYLNPGENASYFWQEKQRLSSLPMNQRRDRLFVGLCVPGSCNNTQIQRAMFNKLRPAADHFGINASVVLDRWNCQDRNKPYVFADYLMCAIIFIVAVLVPAASIYEYRSGSQTQGKIDQSQVVRILLCFSLISNWKCLCNSPKLKSLHCIQGIRFFTAFFIIVIHEGFGMAISPKKNPEWIEESYSDVGKMLFVNGHVLTCSFMVISGFLLAHQSMEMFDRDRFTFCIYMKRLIRRYIRLTPALAVVSIFVAGWMNHLGSGPFWPIATKEEVDNCRQHWWVNLLYLNNYIFADEMCLLHTWYLAVDFQNFVVFFLLLGLISKYKLWINATFGCTLAICICIPLVQTYIEKLDPTLLSYSEYLVNLKAYRTFIRSYITFHHNAGPYFVGVVFGYIFYKKDSKGNKITKLTAAVLWTVSLTLPWGVMLLAYFFYQPNFEYNVVIASAYAGFNKTLFAIGIASIIFLCSTGFGGVVNKFLSSKLLQILGRLSYAIYLIHPQLTRAHYGSLKQNIQLSNYLMISKTVTRCIFTIFFSLLLCLCVELPFLTLFNITIAAKSKENETSVHMKATAPAQLSSKIAEVEEETDQRPAQLQFQDMRL